MGMNRKQQTDTKETSVSIFRNRQFLLIFVIAFFVYMSSTMLNLTLPKYANDLGATAQAVGLLAGMFQIAALSMRPISGQIVDNENRLTMLRIVLFVVLLSAIGFAASGNYWLLVTFRVVHGLAWGVGSTLFLTIASSCVPSEKMTAGIGIYGLGQVFAQTIAPVFALPIAIKFGYNTLYIGNVLLISLCIVLTLFMTMDHTKKEKRTYSYNLKNMIHLPAMLPATMTAVNAIAKSSVRAFLVIFAASMNIVDIGIFFTIQAITISVTRPILSKLADRYGLQNVLIPCQVFMVGGLIIVSYSSSLAMFLVAAVVLGIGTSGEQPILMSECVSSASIEERGKASNTSYVGVDVGGFIGSNLAGIAVAYVGYRYMYRFFAIPVVVFTIVYIIIHYRRTRREALNKVSRKTIS